MPFLVGIADVIGIYGGFFLLVNVFGENPDMYLNKVYQYTDVHDVTSGLIKAAVFGFIIAMVGCFKGLRTEGGAEGVGNATTSAVVMASLLILISDFFLSKLMF